MAHVLPRSRLVIIQHEGTETQREVLFFVSLCLRVFVLNKKYKLVYWKSQIFHFKWFLFMIPANS